MRTKRRIPIPVLAGVAVLLLTLISAHFASGMFARFSVSAAGEGEARVASFSPAVDFPTDSPVTIINNGTDDFGSTEYLVKVKNSGETAVRYEAVVTFTGEDAAKFDDDKLTFSGDLAPEEEAEHTLTLDMSAYFATQVNDKYSTFRNDDISGNKGEAPFEVSVSFTQID